MTNSPERDPAETGLGAEARELAGDVANGCLGDVSVFLIAAGAFVLHVGGAAAIGWFVGGASAAVVGGLVGLGLFVLVVVVVVVVAGAGLVRRWRATKR